MFCNLHLIELLLCRNLILFEPDNGEIYAVHKIHFKVHLIVFIQVFSPTKKKGITNLYGGHSDPLV